MLLLEMMADTVAILAGSLKVNIDSPNSDKGVRMTYMAQLIMACAEMEMEINKTACIHNCPL